jgi:uncharacterized protein (TIGR03437 family)
LKKTTLIPKLILALAAAGALSAQTVTVSPTSLSFSALAGSAAQSQGVTVSGSTGVLFAISNVPWVRVCSGTGCVGQTSVQISNGALTVFADPTGLSVGQYQNAQAVTIDDSSLHAVANIAVTLTVAPIGVSPSSVAFNYQIGSTFPAAQNLTLTSAPNTPYTTNLSGSDCGWLLQPLPGTAPGTVPLSLNTANLPGTAGSHSCTLQFIAGAQTVPVPVTLTVAAAPTVSVAPNPVSLFYQSTSTSSTNSASQVVTLANPGSLPLSFGMLNSNPDWLLISPNQGTIPANGSTTVTFSYITSANKPVSATPYQATAAASIPGAANNLVQIPVSLTVSSSPLLNLSNAPVSFTYQVGGTVPNAQTILATTTNAEANASTGQLIMSISASYTNGGQWFTVPASGQTGTAFQISLNPSVIGSLAAGTYNGTVSVFSPFSANAPDAAHAIQIPVKLTVSNDPQIVLTFGSCSMTANNACPMNFPYQTGVSAAPSQSVTVTSSNSNPLNTIAAAASMTAATGCTSNWLTVSAVAAGSGNSTFTVSANPAGIPNATVCTGAVTVTANGPSGNPSPNSPLQFPVKLYVSSSAMVVVSPISLSFTATPGSGVSAFQNLNVSSTDSSNVSFSASSTTPWLFFDTFTHSTPYAVPVAVNATSLVPGTYSGSITLNSSTLDNGITVPVTLTIPSASMTADKTSLTFNQTLGGTVPASQNVTLSATGGTVAYTTAIGYQSGQPTGWLNATQGGTIAAGATGAVAVSVNGSSLAAGTYNGTVTIAASGVTGSPITVNVTLVVAPGTLAVTPSSLVFSEVAGSAAQTQNVSVTGTPGALNFTMNVTTNKGGNWLGATADTTTTPATVHITATNTGLSPDTYTGTVTITSPGATGSPQTVNVTLTVLQAQTFTVSPATLTFNYTIGTSAPQGQTVQVQSSPGSNIQFSAAVRTGAPWLVVTPNSGATPSTPLTVALNPTGLAGLAAGTYNGFIDITSPSSATSPAATIAVNLTVVAVPKPVIAAIQNAASAIVGPISPGENIVLYGTGLGPATLTMSPVSNNTLSSNVAQTQVFFDGVAAPIYYVSATQTSVFVPYGIAGRTSTQIVVSYQGVQSNPISQTVASAVPGVYTANSSGSGPAAALNYDLKGTYLGVNSANNPAVKGNVVALYLTGEGVTNAPAGIDGMLVNTLYTPVLPVTATVAGQPATVSYKGSAPGSIYGVMQVNIQIPATAPSGPATLLVNVGGSSSQSSVTIAIQ